MQALNKSKFYLVESTLHVRFINFNHLVTMSVDSTKAQPKISSLKGEWIKLTTQPKKIALQPCHRPET
jgi:hypothetical protein